jgi:hypothetical protein
MPKNKGPVKSVLETVAIDSLKPHPQNYREHPDDQLAHIEESIRVNGIYRNIVIASDGTILAGHGVIKAALRLGIKEIPVIRLALNPTSPAAMKILAGDNEISHLGTVNDRLLTQILKDIKDTDVNGLLGTGYDDMMLANLLFVTRPAQEIGDHEEAAHWVGMPDFEGNTEAPRVVVTFENEADRLKFMKVIGVKPVKVVGKVWSVQWPELDRNDLAALKFK